MRKQDNDVILRSMTLVIFFIILTFSFALFFGGHSVSYTHLRAHET